MTSPPAAGAEQNFCAKHGIANCMICGINERLATNIEVQCVLCKHKWVTAPSRDMPMCMLCGGPVMVTKAKAQLRRAK